MRPTLRRRIAMAMLASLASGNVAQRHCLMPDWQAWPSRCDGGASGAYSISNDPLAANLPTTTGTVCDESRIVWLSVLLKHIPLRRNVPLWDQRRPRAHFRSDGAAARFHLIGNRSIAAIHPRR